MDSLHQPAGVPRGAGEEEEGRASRQGRSSSPSSPSSDVLLFLLEHAPLKHWQRDVLEHRPRRGVLLRAAGPDEDHERGLGLATGTRSIMTREGPRRTPRSIDYADHHSGTMATQPRPAQPVQARHRAVPRHRGPLEQGAVRPGVATSATTSRHEADWDKQLGLGPAEDLRGPPDPQRRHLHRHVPDPRLLPPRRAVHLRVRPQERRLPARQSGVRGDRRSSCS